MEEEKVTAYKGFNSDMTCRGFQYEVGKEYEIDGEINPCKRGFHACENPLDVLDYYSDVDGKYCVVEQGGMIVKSEDKQASSKIKINTEIGFIGLFKLGIEWIKEVTNTGKVMEETSLNDHSGNYAQIGSSGDSAQIGSSGDSAQIGSSGDSAKIGSSGYSAKIGSSGYYAQIGSSGDYAQIGSSGDSAQIGSSGDSAQINSTGEDSVVVCAGHNSTVKAKVGSWITLVEWAFDDKKSRCVPVCVKTERVDGERIKEDTWYKLVNGEFKEVGL